MTKLGPHNRLIVGKLPCSHLACSRRDAHAVGLAIMGSGYLSSNFSLTNGTRGPLSMWGRVGCGIRRSTIHGGPHMRREAIRISTGYLTTGWSPALVKVARLTQSISKLKERD